MGEESGEDFPILSHDHLGVGQGRDVGAAPQAVPPGSPGPGRGPLREPRNGRLRVYVSGIKTLYDINHQGDHRYVHRLKIREFFQILLRVVQGLGLKLSGGAHFVISRFNKSS